MSIKITFSKSDTKLSGTVIATLFEGENPGTALKALDKKTAGLLSDALKNDKAFKGKLGQCLSVPAPSKSGVSRVIVLGLGKNADLTALKAEEAGGKLFTAIAGSGDKDAILIAEKAKKLKPEILAAHLAGGFKLRSYRFTRYKSKPAKKNEAPPELKTLKILTDHPANAKTAYDALDAVAQGTFFARDLVNSAPNDLYPESYAKTIRDELKPLGVEVEILDYNKLLKMGMGGICGVGQGSERKPRMVILRWNGSKKKTAKPLGFVGKGVTFDTGGISIKPGAGMDEMKMDMGGSAAVVGLMKTLALRKAKANVVGVVGLAENMPSANAYRPGDVLKSYSGKTIEVLNTDAEGRLVLADCLTHIQKEYKPEFIIDLATLTGAMMVALGHEYCGTFVNDDALWKGLEKASAATGEKLWRMPLDKAWNKEVESDVADIQNLGKSRYAGACTAAAFLEYFVDEGRKWAHMDIAGTAWRKSDQPTVPKYGSGFGVRVLNNLVATNYED